MYTSLPRSESWISHRVSPDENLLRILFNGETPSAVQMRSTNSGSASMGPKVSDISLLRQRGGGNGHTRVAAYYGDVSHHDGRL